MGVMGGLSTLANSFRARSGAAPAMATASLAADDSWKASAIAVLAVCTIAAIIYLPLFTYRMAGRTGVSNDVTEEGALDNLAEERAPGAQPLKGMGVLPPPSHQGRTAAAPPAAEASTVRATTVATPNGRGSSQRTRSPDA